MIEGGRIIEDGSPATLAEAPIPATRPSRRRKAGPRAIGRSRMAPPARRWRLRHRRGEDPRPRCGREGGRANHPSGLEALAWPADTLSQAMEAIAERVLPKQRPRRLSPRPAGHRRGKCARLVALAGGCGRRLGVIVEPKERTTSHRRGTAGRRRPGLGGDAHRTRTPLLCPAWTRGRAVARSTCSLPIRRDSRLHHRCRHRSCGLAGCARANRRVLRSGGPVPGGRASGERILNPRIGKGELLLRLLVRAIGDGISRAGSPRPAACACCHVDRAVRCSPSALRRLVVASVRRPWRATCRVGGCWHGPSCC